jgi:hypothetical protein
MKKVLFLIIILFTMTLSAQSKPYDMGNSAEITAINEQTGSIFGSNASERIITTSVVFGELAILVLVLVYWKKTRTDYKESNVNRYKKNIRAIRDERIKPTVLNKNSSKRKAMPKLIEKKKLTARSITSTAKKLSISKGELFLAAKIQQLQNQTR